MTSAFLRVRPEVVPTMISNQVVEHRQACLSAAACLLRHFLRHRQKIGTSDSSSFTSRSNSLFSVALSREVAVELVRPGASQLKEGAMAQNVSARGMRVATEHIWRPEDRVFLTSSKSDFRAQARVVYCQPMENNRFAVGLELLAPVGKIFV